MEPLDTVTEVHTANIELLERLHPLDKEAANSDYLTVTYGSLQRLRGKRAG